MAGDPPKLTIASEQSEAELKKQLALDLLRWPTREMAANLLRVTRGHGKPHELPQQIIDLSGAILEASEHSNAWGIWSVMQEVLREAIPDRSHYDIGDCYDTMISGALQVTASHLLGQRAQEARGQEEMREGVKQLEVVKEERRLRQEAEARAAEPARKAERKAAKLRRPAAPPRSKAVAVPTPQVPVEEDIDPSAWKSTADYMRLRQAQLKRLRERQS